VVVGNACACKPGYTWVDPNCGARPRRWDQSPSWQCVGVNECVLDLCARVACPPHLIPSLTTSTNAPNQRVLSFLPHSNSVHEC
jgi:hypothetical protein